eukprot:3637556-Ditylum_brightwellii.AAC.1
MSGKNTIVVSTSSRVAPPSTIIFPNEIAIDDDTATMSAIQRKEDCNMLLNDTIVASKLVDLNHQTRVFGDYLYEMWDTPQKMSQVNHNV